MHLFDEEAHMRNKPGDSRITRSVKRFGCGENKSEGLETIGSGQRIKGASKNVSAEIFPFQDLTPDMFAYRLSRRAAAILNEGVTYDMTRRLDKEAIKVRILSLLKDRPLRNAEIRAFTDLERQQVTVVLKELEAEGQVRLKGKGAGARWHLTSSIA